MAIPVPKPKHRRRIPKQRYRHEFSPLLKEKIRRQFDYKCAECGGPAWEIHHVKQRSLGGRAVFTNGLLLCRWCHMYIHDHPEREKYWVDIFQKRYGRHFYKDRYDLECEFWINDLRSCKDRDIRLWLKYNA